MSKACASGIRWQRSSDRQSHEPRCASAQVAGLHRVGPGETARRQIARQDHAL